MTDRSDRIAASLKTMFDRSRGIDPAAVEKLIDAIDARLDAARIEAAQRTDSVGLAIVTHAQADVLRIAREWREEHDG